MNTRLGKKCESDILVSIIIPTYKRDVRYLDRAIKSLLSQSYLNIEVIVVDDNSPDSQYRIVNDKYMQRFINSKNVVYIKNEKNLGGSLARNKGINIARGKYITFLDDDDKYLPKKVENQLKYMLEKGLDLSFTNLKIVNKDEKIVDYRSFEYISDFTNDSLLKYHLMKHLTGTPTFMFKKKSLIDIGGFQKVDVGQEFYLMLKSIEQNLKIGYLNVSDVIAYRHDDEGISNGPKKIRGERKLYEFKKNYFSNLSTSEIRYIRFRHHAVISIAYIRNKQYMKAFYSLFKMFLTSPVTSLIEIVNQIKKILTLK